MYIHGCVYVSRERQASQFPSLLYSQLRLFPSLSTAKTTMRPSCCLRICLCLRMCPLTEEEDQENAYQKRHCVLPCADRRPFAGCVKLMPLLAQYPP